jgi:uncharacterized protein (TIGR03435 family)
MRGWRLHIVTTLVAVSSVGTGAQAPQEQRPAFEVASIKRNESGQAFIRLDIQRGHVVAENIPLKQFIRAAYTLQLYQIAGAPSWADSTRFDITATTGRDLFEPAPWLPGGKFLLAQSMMQSLLADRFKMVAHTEQREGQGYALVLSAPDRPSRLTAAKVPCAPDCGVKVGAGTVRARNVPLTTFAELISQFVGRLVLDSTGVTGTFDIELRWAPEAQLATSDAPSLFTALQEQLGLRLESRRLPITTLVIDSIEQPTPD